MGLAPAATLRRPSRTMLQASTVAVVVPSPATSSVFLATSLTSSAPILLVRVLELDLLGDGDAVVGDRGCAPLLVEDDVAALGAERDADRVGELVHARLEASRASSSNEMILAISSRPSWGDKCEKYKNLGVGVPLWN